MMSRPNTFSTRTISMKIAGTKYQYGAMARITNGAASSASDTPPYIAASPSSMSPFRIPNTSSTAVSAKTKSMGPSLRAAASVLRGHILPKAPEELDSAEDDRPPRHQVVSTTLGRHHRADRDDGAADAPEPADEHILASERLGGRRRLLLDADHRAALDEALEAARVANAHPRRTVQLDRVRYLELRILGKPGGHGRLQRGTCVDIHAVLKQRHVLDVVDPHVARKEPGLAVRQRHADPRLAALLLDPAELHLQPHGKLDDRHGGRSGIVIDHCGLFDNARFHRQSTPEIGSSTACDMPGGWTAGSITGSDSGPCPPA